MHEREKLHLKKYIIYNNEDTLLLTIVQTQITLKLSHYIPVENKILYWKYCYLKAINKIYVKALKIKFQN